MSALVTRNKATRAHLKLKYRNNLDMILIILLSSQLAVLLFPVKIPFYDIAIVRC